METSLFLSQHSNEDAHLGALIKPSPRLCPFTRDTFLPRDIIYVSAN